MTSIPITSQRGEAAMEPAHRVHLLQRVLLLSGALSSALYVGTDVMCSLRYRGYSFAHQAISELSAIGAPTAQLWSTVMWGYVALFIAFTVGVFRMARGNRALKATATLFVVFLLSGPLWRFFPLDQQRGELTPAEIGHIAMGAFTVALYLGWTLAGAFALGRRFRTFSLVLLIPMAVFGALTFIYPARASAGEPTTWLGIIERVSIYGYLLWIAVLSVALFRRSSA